ncbi:GNAT family N-acetyltransferase [uncultured Traorella sp.]|uniref:GNAT family N-acetyltransferase n=1 Tax=uncultured Traorella sp. TaxID=1929048 RepID=UPI0025D77683|nr:GNAT family N-acetyltransferase [uncultured Traorella sp.]
MNSHFIEIVKYDQRKMEREVINLWNECCQFDLITTEKFRQFIIFDENFNNELCLVAIDIDKVVGFIYGYKRQYPYLDKGLESEKGWIASIFVKKEYRHHGIAKRLLENIEQKIKEKGAKTIILGANSPHYFFSGLDIDNYPEATSFFEKNGYNSFEKHYSMGMNLHFFDLSEKSKERKKNFEDFGFQFKVFDYSYSLELLEFLKTEFGGGWKYNALEAMRKSKAHERIMIVLAPNGTICGCANRAIDDNEMRFGPIGISKKVRNLRIGTVLLECSMLEMRKRGIYRMFFMTTDENGRRYYERVGLKVIRTYYSYKKDL